jgi:hypothetical protein
VVEDRPELDFFGRYETPHGLVRVTDGVRFHPKRRDILDAIRTYDYSKADPGNDPYRERDFFVVKMGATFFGKVDYYDLDLRNGSEDPSDPAKTKRILTIMRAEEY